MVRVERGELMFCTICKNELRDCTCPDIEERLRRLQTPDSHVLVPDCPACAKPRAICKCGYMEYHRAVVAECVRLMGEQNRGFFDQGCTYEEGFREKRPAEEEAYAQFEAMS